jgi:hypothetical protein
MEKDYPGKMVILHILCLCKIEEIFTIVITYLFN